MLVKAGFKTTFLALCITRSSEGGLGDGLVWSSKVRVLISSPKGSPTAAELRLAASKLISVSEKQAQMLSEWRWVGGRGFGRGVTGEVLNKP